MTISRREILGRGAAAAAASVLPGPLRAAEALAQAPPAPRFRRIPPRRAAFAGALRTRFEARPAGARGFTQGLLLVAVEDLPSAEAAGTRGSESSFSITFRGSGRRALPQGTFELRHPSLGAMLLFLVPGPAGREASYTAVFQRRPGRRERAARPAKA